MSVILTFSRPTPETYQIVHVGAFYRTPRNYNVNIVYQYVESISANVYVLLKFDFNMEYIAPESLNERFICVANE